VTTEREQQRIDSWGEHDEACAMNPDKWCDSISEQPDCTCDEIRIGREADYADRMYDQMKDEGRL